MKALEAFYKAVNELREFTLVRGEPDYDLEIVIEESDPKYPPRDRDELDKLVKALERLRRGALRHFVPAPKKVVGLNYNQLADAISKVDWRKGESRSRNVIKSGLRVIDAYLQSKKVSKGRVPARSKTSGCALPASNLPKANPTHCTLLEFFRSKTSPPAAAAKLKASKERSWRRAGRLPNPQSHGYRSQRGNRAVPSHYKRAELERLWLEDHSTPPLPTGPQATTGSHSITGNPS